MLSRFCRLPPKFCSHLRLESWSIPSEDPYEEAVRQLLEQAPCSPEYVPDPMELEDHVPVYIPEPEHPEDLQSASIIVTHNQRRPPLSPIPSPSTRQARAYIPDAVRDIERKDDDPLYRRLYNRRVSYQVDVRSRESSEFYTRHHDAQTDRAAVRAEIEVLRRERLAYEQESIQTRQDLARCQWAALPARDATREMALISSIFGNGWSRNLKARCVESALTRISNHDVAEPQ
ncbi:hypothetical protein Tco_0744059 [Tanacetum coccineum]